MDKMEQIKTVFGTADDLPLQQAVLLLQCMSFRSGLQLFGPLLLAYRMQLFRHLSFL